MENKPLLSIVIPTRNRQKYAICCIQTILSKFKDNIELIVSDNSDTNELQNDIYEQINDFRLKYNYDPKPMSTVHNFNNAMKNVAGEYVCFIGDDDCVLPNIIDLVIFAKCNKIDAITSRNMVGYSWPNDYSTGEEKIYPFTCRIKKINPEKELIRFIKTNSVNYLQFNLPKIYHGIVRKECFDQVKDKIGYYFGGLSVDIFSSVAISLVSKNLILINYPFTIAGSSPISDLTHRSKMAKEIELSAAPHFRERGYYEWSSLVPKLYSGETIWSESCIKALIEFERFDIIDKINPYILAANISISQPRLEKKILKEYFQADYSLCKMIRYKWCKLNAFYSNNRKRIIRKIDIICFAKVKKIEKIIGVTNIEKATNNFEFFIKSKNIYLNKYLDRYTTK